MEKIWLKRYPEGVPEEIDPSPYASIIDLFDEGCREYRESIALGSLGVYMSYSQFQQKTFQLAAYFQEVLALKKGDRIALMMPNIMQYPVATFAALRAGLVVVNVNPLYTVTELRNQLRDAEVDAIIVLANFAHVVADVLPEVNVKHVIVTQVGDLFSTPKRQLINFVVKYIKRKVPAYKLPDALSYLKALEEGALHDVNPVDTQSDDVAFLQYTGGTTGVPKAAALTHRNIIANVLQVNAMFSRFLNQGEEIFISPLPLYHIFSTMQQLVLVKFGGTNYLIANPRDLPGMVSDIGDVKFTVFVGLNTLFNALLDYDDFAKLDFSDLRYTISGGMSLQEDVAKRWKKTTNCPIYDAYGLTETSPALVMNPLSGPIKPGSIGLPLPSTDIVILDEEDKPVEVGEVGELCVKGPQVMLSYWKKPDETQAAFTQDGYFRTGDMAKIDDEGYVFIVDRKKDMIIVSGFNVYPNEIENVIIQHPGVGEVGVVGIQDDHSGERVKAVIVRKDPSLTEEEVIAHCRKSLTGYKVPSSVEFISELPKTVVGKVLRRALRPSQTQRVE